MKKMIEQYVILDMKGNLVENIEDMETTSLRVYNREISATISKIDTGNSDMSLHIAQACVAACDEYVPLEPEVREEIDDGSD